MAQEDAVTRVLALAARHVNASPREPIPEETLLRAVKGCAVPEKFRPHVKAFFDETDLTILADLVMSGAVGWKELSRGAAEFLPPHHETRVWLHERAGFKMV